MKRVVSLAVAALAFSACQDASGPERAAPTVPQTVNAAKGTPIPGDYIITLRGDVTDVAAVAQSISGLHKGALKHLYRTALKGFAVKNLSEAAAAAIANDPRVERIEADQIMTISTNQPGATWGLDRVDQRDLTPTDGYNYFADGSNVAAYIIDTGINLVNGDFGGRAITGVDEVTAGGPAEDCNGHGTHVSGTVGGAIYGIAKNVALIAVRVLDCGGSGSTSGVIAGVDWVTSDHTTATSPRYGTPAIANMSLGGGASATLDNAVANSIIAGVTYAIAAGNGNIFGIAQDACTTSPARVSTAITVSATDNTDRKASWANYGTCVDIFAPGVNITSDWYNAPTNTISGTSMATPHVAGAAALYLSVHPGALPAEVSGALINNATPGKVTNAGTGSPNRLLYTSFITSGPAGPPVARYTFGCTGLACSFNGSTSSADAGANFTWSWGDQTADASGTTRTASHTFAQAGTSPVTLTVTNPDNQVGTVSQNVTVALVVNSVARFTKSCSSRTCTFDASTSSNATSFAWSFGDGTTATGVTVSHRFARNRNYTVTLTTQPGNSTATAPVTCRSSCS